MKKRILIMTLALAMVVGTIGCGEKQTDGVAQGEVVERVISNTSEEEEEKIDMDSIQDVDEINSETEEFLREQEHKTVQATVEVPEPAQEAGDHYVLNVDSKKFHRADCTSVKRMNSANKQDYTGSRESLISKGYVPCDNCQP